MTSAPRSARWRVQSGPETACSSATTRIPSSGSISCPSIRLRQTEDVLRDVGEHQVVVDRSDLVEARLAELALDVVLGREAEAAVGVEAHVRGLPRGLRGEKLGHVRLGAARPAGVEEARTLPAHEVRGLGVRVRARERQRHALVLPDRTAEDDPLLRVGRGAGDEPARVADAFGRDEDPLGVPAVDDVAEALALLADEILHRDLEVLDEELVRVVVDHGLDRPRLDRAPCGLDVDEEDRQPPRLVVEALVRRGAREQQHEVRLFEAARPDLLAVHDVAVASSHGHRLDARRLAPRGRLGHAEGLQPQLPRRDARQIAALLLGVPMTYICAWHAAALPPWRWISSRMTLASAIPRPLPPNSSGMSAASQPALVSASTKSVGYSRARSMARQ